jgi:hypothetical protein
MFITDSVYDAARKTSILFASVLCVPAAVLLELKAGLIAALYLPTPPTKYFCDGLWMAEYAACSDTVSLMWLGVAFFVVSPLLIGALVLAARRSNIAFLLTAVAILGLTTASWRF